jgi:hypothetical protein
MRDDTSAHAMMTAMPSVATIIASTAGAPE